MVKVGLADEPVLIITAGGVSQSSGTNAEALGPLPGTRRTEKRYGGVHKARLLLVPAKTPALSRCSPRGRSMSSVPGSPALASAHFALHGVVGKSDSPQPCKTHP